MEITLRPYNLSDVDDFMAWACDDQVIETCILRRYIRSNSSREDIVNYFNQFVIPHPWYRAICLNGLPVGFVSVKPGARAATKHRAHISNAVGRKYWSQGIATKASGMAVSTAFKEIPGLLRIQSYVAPENVACWRGSEKLGFRREGLLRKHFVRNGEVQDSYVYSILSTDLIPSRL